VRLSVLPCRGGDDVLRRLFEPLGYKVTAKRHVLDEKFPEWGDSAYFMVTLSGKKVLRELLTHLYVLMPVLDDDKHYWVSDDEVEKLLKHGAGWLADDPERELITNRYLKHRRNLAKEALSRLIDEEEPGADDAAEAHAIEEEVVEKPLSLNDQCLGAVVAALKGCGANKVLDLGCGEGKLLRELLKEKQFGLILGMSLGERWRSPASACGWTACRQCSRSGLSLTMARGPTGTSG
jgi:3' terminal RNA ribose 2'-O-methyltransferase Hen1